MVSSRVRQFKLNKTKKNRKRVDWLNWVAKIFFWLLFFAFWGFCFWIFFFSPLLVVEKINIVNDKVDKEEVKKTVDEQLTGKHLNLVSKRNLILLPKKKIEQVLIEKFRLIKEVEISRVFPTAMLVRIVERESLLVWCVRGECFLLDETGEVFYRLSPSDPEWDSEALIRVEDRSQKELQIGQRIVDQRLVQFYQKIPQLMQQQLGVEVEKRLNTPSSMSGEIRCKTKSSWEVYFNTNDLIENQISILKGILDSKISKDQLEQLEYIDLRLKGRVTYKLRNQEQTEEQAEQEDQPAEPQPEPAALPKEEKKNDKKDKKNG